jgi:hypothetical protein
VAGDTKSTNFPTTPGAYDTSFNSNDVRYADVFVSKLNSNLTQLLASTFLGGSYGDSAFALAIDRSGNVYVAGVARSSDFPTTPGAYDIGYNGDEAFISKFDSNLTNLLASTFLGGSYFDEANVLAIDRSGNVYVAGITLSDNFPTTPGAYGRRYNGNVDVFVSKFDANLTNLLASTYLGGSKYDEVGLHAIAIDSSGNVYVAGYTGSDDFPTTPGAYDIGYNGGDHDVFVSKFDSNLTKLLASTFLGGIRNESAKALAIDRSGNVYVGGGTGSDDFPTTPGAYDRRYNDVFVSKFDSNLTKLLASTFLGGSFSDEAKAIAIDSSGNVYVAGRTASYDFPTTPGAYDRRHNGGFDDAFISKFDANLTNLLASTYLGGSKDDRAYALAIDRSGNVYVVGETASDDFPTTPGAYDRNCGTDGKCNYDGLSPFPDPDAFISKFDANLSVGKSDKGRKK